MNRITIQADQGHVTIDKNIYGHFAEHLGRCIYEGIWVGEDSPIPNTRGIRNDVAAALRQLTIPVLRWPGGCFADEYHWKDGIGPRQERPSIVNTHWGGVTENNHFGTHEFLDLCEQIEAEPYICGNVGSGTVQEMQQWVEYITHDGRSPMADLRRQNGRDLPWNLRYFGVGNENWGCGGSMRPEYYADVYRRYQTYVRDFGENHIFKIACGANRDDYHWTEVLMREADRFMHGLSLHYYTVPGTWEQKGSATDFDEGAWYTTLQRALFMDELVRRTSTIMDAYDPDRRVALIVDEWGTWYDSEPGTNPGFLYQQNTLRDALVAGLTLNIFNNYSQRVRMANIAQTINVLQAIILTDGPRMITTPTYHVFDMYKHHQNATLLPCAVDCDDYTASNGQSIPRLSVSASRSAAGILHLTICHTDPHHSTEARCVLRGAIPQAVRGTVLTAATMNAHNTFEHQDQVTPVAFDGTSLSGNDLTITLPPMSVVSLALHLT